jgi:hypothetical protein
MTGKQTSLAAVLGEDTVISGRPAMRRLTNCALLLTAIAGPLAADPASPPVAGSVAGKKLIEFGWDEPDTFDGCV